MVKSHNLPVFHYKQKSDKRQGDNYHIISGIYSAPIINQT